MSLLFILMMLIPFIGFLFGLFFPAKQERWISSFAIFIVSAHAIVLIAFSVLWFLNGRTLIDSKSLILLKTQGFEFFLDYSFDKISFVFMLAGSFLTFIVCMFSRYYLHKEQGYKRFFSTIMLFYFGYNTIVMAGNLETLFVGWEILGISSFLLISFYRERLLPVKNAVKVFSIYRLGDLGILLAIWMNHHLWEQHIVFTKYLNFDVVSEQVQHHPYASLIVSFSILLAALVKSAQFPFSSWLPRAMEGPTPSSAIFYGSLSVHLGVFLLLRTFPFWEHVMFMKIAVIVFGVFTTVIATSISRVQSTIKSQIAYSSIAQIGLMFIEIGFGLTNVALLHFIANSFFRTYQLLVSPSTVSYLIHKQFFSSIPPRKTMEDSLPKRIGYTFYMLSIKEWNLDYLMSNYVWYPFEKIGKVISFVSSKFLVIFSIVVVAACMYFVFFDRGVFTSCSYVLSIISVIIGFLVIVKSYREKKDVLSSFILVVIGHFWIILAIGFINSLDLNHFFIYLGGIIVSSIIGIFCINYLLKREKEVNLFKHHGHSYEYPLLSFVFLVACLGMSAFPITPSFIGLDMVLIYFHEDRLGLSVLTSLSFMLAGLSLIRMYSKLFLGPHTKTYHEIAYKSS